MATKKKQKPNYLKEVLQEVRQRHMNRVIPTKDPFPDRTPSTLTPMMPSAVEVKKKEGKRGAAAQTKPAPPVPITLTKLDFEVLRDYDWKEREKRLKTWRDDLGISKSHRHYKRGRQDVSENQHQPERAPNDQPRANKKERLKKKSRTTQLILKHELQGVTGLKIRAPGDPSSRKGSGGQQHLQKGISDRRRRSYQSMQKEKMQRLGMPLTTMKDQDRANELKKTFGKGWADGIPTSRRPSVRHSIHRKHSTGSWGEHHHHHHHHHHHYHHYKGEDDSSSSTPPSPGESMESVQLNTLLQGMQDENQKDDSESDDGTEVRKPNEKYERPNAYPEYQDMCFGNIQLVERAAVKPLTKDHKGYEFYMTLADPGVGLGLGRTQALKIKFFKPEGPQQGRSARIFERKKLEKSKKIQDAQRRKEEEAEAEKHRQEALRVSVVQDVKQIVKTLNLSEEEKKSYARRLVEFEEGLMKIPGVAPGFKIEVEPLSHVPSQIEVPIGTGGGGTKSAGGGGGGGSSKRNQYTRPPRRVWYTPLPLTVKRYYRTNWKKIRFDVRDQMRQRNFWPKLWINFEESHPKMMYDLIHAKLAVKNFDKHGFKRDYDWGKGVHPDYVDWILEDMVPHPGQYYYDDQTPVRRASHEGTDFLTSDWFVKPPKFVPDSPLEPAFNQFDFCGYGNREKSYFLAFTLPREILHYYAPSRRGLSIFQTIPKPPYAFPGYTFKRWLKMPLDQKLPQYYPFPKRFSIWTRGKIGDSIQCTSSDFNLDDPNILKRDLKYNLYHDPHAKKYLLQKKVLDRIWELGIINSKGEVKCTMAEFNLNRRYLRDYEWLEECLRRWNLSWGDRQKSNKLTKEINIQDLNWDEKKLMWKRKLDICKYYQERRDEKEELVQRRNEDRYERAAVAAASRRRRVINALQHEAYVKQKWMDNRRRNVRQAEVRRQLLLQRLCKERHERAEQHRMYYSLLQTMERMEKQRDFWERRQENHQLKSERMKTIQEEMRKDFMDAVVKHEMRHYRLWKDTGKSRRLKEMKEKSDLELARKYTKIWRDKVAQRKRDEYQRDPLHATVWIPKHNLMGTISLIKQQAHLGAYNKAADKFSRLIGSSKADIKTGKVETLKAVSFSFKSEKSRRELDLDYILGSTDEFSMSDSEVSNSGGYNGRKK